MESIAFDQNGRELSPLSVELPLSRAMAADLSFTTPAKCQRNWTHSV